jgi:hypothetical protein
MSWSPERTQPREPIRDKRDAPVGVPRARQLSHRGAGQNAGRLHRCPGDAFSDQPVPQLKDLTAPAAEGAVSLRRPASASGVRTVAATPWPCRCRSPRPFARRRRSLGSAKRLSRKSSSALLCPASRLRRRWAL